MNEIRNKWLAERAQDVRASIEALRRDVEPLAYLQLGWRPPDGGWSIAQVLEHLIVTEESYLPALQGALQKTVATTSSEWTPSLIGGFLIRSQLPEAKTKMKTPARWQPGPGSRANPVQEYIATRERLLELMRQADGKDLRRARLSSPAARFIRLNAGDAFMTLVVHTQRHLRQIERIKAHPGFPVG